LVNYIAGWYKENITAVFWRRFCRNCESKRIKYIWVIGYVVFDLLVNFWGVQINNPKEPGDCLKKFEPTKEKYKRVKNIMK
jgi:hypothetical protein